MAAAAANPPPQYPTADWHRLQEQLDEQTRRIDRLYKAIGPHLAELEESAAALEKQQQEDKALAMERVWESTGAGFTQRAECSPTAQSFAAVAEDGSIRICDLNGKLLRSLHYKEETIRTVAYSPDGARLLAGTVAGKVLLWELKSSAVREVAQRPYQIDRVGWLGKTSRALVVSARGEAVKGPEPEEMRNVQGDLFETENGQILWKFTAWQHLDYQNLMAAPNGEWVAVLKIFKGRGAYLLDARSGEIMSSLLLNAGQGLSVAVSPDSRTPDIEPSKVRIFGHFPGI
jgi:WD40 repeat protein